MDKEALPRLDTHPELVKRILPLCRLKAGEVWEDPVRGHRVGVLDASAKGDIYKLLGGDKSVCGIHDPPYNISVGKKNTADLFSTDSKTYIDFTRLWVTNAEASLAENSHLYIWLGADQEKGFQPLPEVMLLLREFSSLKSRSFITLRNQRGYGTQKNWMCLRQELLYYTKGNPYFQVVYTEIPKILKGYYKKVGGEIRENLERSRSENLRPGNVWVDIQQVFYRLKENVPGAYAQKPLAAIIRILRASTKEGDLVTDFFSHAGTTLVACERENRLCYTSDINPVFAELSIRRLEHLRKTGEAGFQCGNPFPELGASLEISG